MGTHPGWTQGAHLRTSEGEGLPETRAGAEESERRSHHPLLETGEPKKHITHKEVPTVREFYTVFLDLADQNKPSSVESNEVILRMRS